MDAKQSPVKNLRTRKRVSSDDGRHSVFHKAVRLLRPKDDSSLSQVVQARKILLYRDEMVIQEMRDRVIAAALRDESMLTKLKRIIVGRSLLSGDFTFDGLTGVDEFVLKPSAKWTLGAELGADIELKWNLGNDKNIDNVILMLFSVMPVRNLSEVVHQIRSQRSDTPIESLVYPGMPISIWGTVRRKVDLLPNEIYLRNERRSAQVIFEHVHLLDQSLYFLRGRPLYVLGIIDDIKKKLVIKAGAVLLGQIQETNSW